MRDNWITLRNGRPYHLGGPNPAAVMPQATAWSLAQINRFGGHAARPYSVAEHSLLVADIVMRELAGDVHAVFAALLHDAHESVVGDQHTPGKHELGEPWRQYERRHELVFRSAFALHTAMDVHGALIKRADLIALATEKRDLLPTTGPAAAMAWQCLEGVEPLARVDLMDRARIAAPWTFWRDAWLDRYTELEWARNAAIFGDGHA